MSNCRYVRLVAEAVCVRRVLMAGVVMLLCAAMTAMGAAPDIAGTYTVDTVFEAPTYNEWSGDLDIDPGVTCTITNGCTIEYVTGRFDLGGLLVIHDGGKLEHNGATLESGQGNDMTILPGGELLFKGDGGVLKGFNNLTVTVSSNAIMRVNMDAADDIAEFQHESALSLDTDGDIYVDQGILKFTQNPTVAHTVSGTITVAAGAKLLFSRVDPEQPWSGVTIQGAGVTEIGGGFQMDGGLVALGTTGTNIWSGQDVVLDNGAELRIPVGTILRRTGSGDHQGTGFITVYGDYEFDSASGAGGWHRVSVENGGTWLLELANDYAVKFGVVSNDVGGTIEVALAGDTLKCGFTHLASAYGGGSIDIRDGSTIRVTRGELEIGSACDTYFNGGAPGSTLNFNVYLTNSTLDIQDLTSGITTIGSGSTLTMRGADAKLLDNTTDVIDGDLATVNGTLRFDSGFSLTPGGGGTLTVGSSGTLSADGTLSGNLDCAGTCRVEVAAADSDTLTVNGTVTLTGSPTLTVVETLPGSSNQYIIIENDGTDAVVGTFANSTVTLAGRTYDISYTGGSDNNDIVLTFAPAGTIFTFR